MTFPLLQTFLISRAPRKGAFPFPPSTLWHPIADLWAQDFSLYCWFVLSHGPRKQPKKTAKKKIEVLTFVLDSK